MFSTTAPEPKFGREERTTEKVQSMNAIYLLEDIILSIIPIVYYSFIIYYFRIAKLSKKRKILKLFNETNINNTKWIFIRDPSISIK